MPRLVLPSVLPRTFSCGISGFWTHLTQPHYPLQILHQGIIVLLFICRPPGYKEFNCRRLVRRYYKSLVQYSAVWCGGAFYSPALKSLGFHTLVLFLQGTDWLSRPEIRTLCRLTISVCSSCGTNMFCRVVAPFTRFTAARASVERFKPAVTTKFEIQARERWCITRRWRLCRFLPLLPSCAYRPHARRLYYRGMLWRSQLSHSDMTVRVVSFSEF